MTTDLVTFTEEILNEKLHFFAVQAVCSEKFAVFFMCLLLNFAKFSEQLSFQNTCEWLLLNKLFMSVVIKYRKLKSASKKLAVDTFLFVALCVFKICK